MTKKNRRLKNTALVVSLTTIFAFNTIIVVKQDNKITPVSADTQNYSLTINQTNKAEQGTTTLQRTSQLNGTNMAINVQGSFYYNQQQSDQSTPDYFWVNNMTYDPIVYSNDAQGMIILQLTPYNINTATTLNLTLTIDIKTQIVGTTNNQQYYINDIIYRSEQDWSFLLNRQDWNTTGKVYDLKQELENPTNAYIYQKTENSTFFEYTNNMQLQSPKTFTKNITLTINTNIVYYVYYFYPSIRELAGGYEQYKSTGRGITLNDNIYINGTMVIPTGTYEVVDIGGLMFTILTMPFSFISQAFNLTLFPNTPYQVNISNLFLVIIAVLIFTWLISIIIKSFIGK